MCVFFVFFLKKGLPVVFAVLEENYYEIWATLSILRDGNLSQNQTFFKEWGKCFLVVHYATL